MLDGLEGIVRDAIQSPSGVKPAVAVDWPARYPTLIKVLPKIAPDVSAVEILVAQPKTIASRAVRSARYWWSKRWQRSTSLCFGGCGIQALFRDCSEQDDLISSPRAIALRVMRTSRRWFAIFERPQRKVGCRTGSRTRSATM